MLVKPNTVEAYQSIISAQLQMTVRSLSKRFYSVWRTSISGPGQCEETGLMVRSGSSADASKVAKRSSQTGREPVFPRRIVIPHCF